MHASLRPRQNVVLSICWLLFAALATLAAASKSVPVIVGGLGGAVAGGLQWAAIVSGQSAFMLAQTALDVRRAFRATKPGTVYLWYIWVFQLGAVWGPMLTSLSAASPVGRVADAVATYAWFAFVREALTLRPLIGLNAADNAAKQ